jgi:hypothetical protein
MKYIVSYLVSNGNGIHCIVNLVPLAEGKSMIRGRHVLIRSIACERPSGVHTTLPVPIKIKISQLISLFLPPLPNKPSDSP